MQQLYLLLEDIKKKPNPQNVKKYCEALEELGFEKQQISKKVKSDVDNYDQSTLNHYIPQEYKNKSQSRNSRIGVLKRMKYGMRDFAIDMSEPIKEIGHEIQK